MCERYGKWFGGVAFTVFVSVFPQAHLQGAAGGKKGGKGLFWWAHFSRHSVSSLGLLSGINPMIGPQNCGKLVFGFATECRVFGFATETVHYGRPPNCAFAAHLGVCAR